MLHNIFLKTLRDRRRGLFWWSIGLIALIAYMTAVYPSFQSSTEIMKEYVETLPEALKATFITTSGDIFSPEGYLSVYLFNYLSPLLLLFFTIGLGASAIAGEEDKGTLDLLLSYPIPRWRVVLEKFAALLAGAFLLSTIFYVSLLIGIKAIDMDIDIGRLTQAVISQFLIISTLGALALALGCATGKRGTSIGIATVVAVASYFLNALTPLADTLEPYQKLSLFYYYIGADPLKNGLDLGHAAVLIILTIIFVSVALFTFQRRDIAV